MKYVLKEITPLGKDDLFIARYYPNNLMDFPLHFHEDFELNLTLNAKGKRIVGNTTEDFDELDLVIFSPDVLHCYKRSSDSPDVRCEVIVVQFPKDLPSWKIFSTAQMELTKNLLSHPYSGLRFSHKTIARVKDDLMKLCSLDGFEGALLFLSILNELACTDKSEISYIGSGSFYSTSDSHSRRINKIIKYVESNYASRITLDSIGELVGMSASSVCRFFKKKTRHNFLDYLNSFRIEKAIDMIIRTELTISEISYACGFNNISNFNRIFLNRTGTTPSDYRKTLKDAAVEQAAQ